MSMLPQWDLTDWNTLTQTLEDPKQGVDYCCAVPIEMAAGRRVRLSVSPAPTHTLNHKHVVVHPQVSPGTVRVTTMYRGPLPLG